MSHRTLALVWLFLGCLSQAGMLRAEEKQDLEWCRQLIALLRENDPQRWRDGQRLINLIPADSPYRPVANQAKAVLSIRQQQYSQAWKELNSTPATTDKAPAVVRIEQSKLKLWLLLEARSASAAEAEIKNMTLLAIGKDVNDSERVDACMFLGGTCRMLEACRDKSVVSPTVRDKVRTLVTSQSYKSANSIFQTAYDDVSAWDNELRKYISRFQGGSSSIEATIASLQAEADDAEKLDLGYRQQLDDATQHLKAEEKIQQAAAHERFKVEQEWKKETPGRPRKPQEPRRPLALENGTTRNPRMSGPLRNRIAHL